LPNQLKSSWQTKQLLNFYRFRHEGPFKDIGTVNDCRILSVRISRQT
jgi:hypothetical protein